MEITNKGYINFNDKYDKKTDKFMSASMSFSNGKDKHGNWAKGYIEVVAFGDNITKLEASIGNLIEIKGRYSHKKADEKGVYPQIAISEFLTEVETSPFGNQSVTISDIDMPF